MVSTANSLLPDERLIFPQIKKYEGPVLTRDNYNIDDETIFRWFYVPFVMTDVLRDYLDTIYTISSMLRLSEIKKINREIKNIENDYLYERKKFFKDRIKTLEQERADDLQEEMKSTINYICQNIYKTVEKENPEYEVDMKMVIAASYMSYFIFSAISSYTYEYIDVIRQKYRYETKNVMSGVFFKWREPLKKLSQFYIKIDDELVKIYSAEIKKLMYDIQIIGDNERR